MIAYVLTGFWIMVLAGFAVLAWSDWHLTRSTEDFRWAIVLSLLAALPLVA